MTDRAQDLNGLTAYVLARAEEAARLIIERAEKKAERIRAEGRKEAEAREEEIVKAGLSDIEKEEKQILSQAKLRLEGETLKAKAKTIEDLLSAVRGRLDRIRTEEGKAYSDLLLALIRRSIAEEGAESVVVYLSEDDASRSGKDLAGSLNGEGNLKGIDIKPCGISGGAIIEFPEKRLQIDISFEELLRELRGRIERRVEEEIFSSLGRKEEGDGDQG